MQKLKKEIEEKHANDTDLYPDTQDAPTDNSMTIPLEEPNQKQSKTKDTSKDKNVIELPKEEEKPTYKQGEEVDLMIWQKTELGFKVIIDNKYPGLVYGDQVFQYVHTGDYLKGYIATVRPDGKIDCTLQPTGQQYAKDFAEVLLQYLKDNGGVCNLGDKSDAEDIKRLFQVSKKVYKKAVGDLYKRRLITVEPLAIRLV